MCMGSMRFLQGVGGLEGGLTKSGLVHGTHDAMGVMVRAS